MVWTLDDYPSSMKNFEYTTRKKAIDMANAMVDDGYKEGDAIPIAMEEAKKWRENASPDEIEHYRKHGKVTTRSKESKHYENNPERMEETEVVRAHEEGWAVESGGAKNPSHVFEKKEEAVQRAKEIAENKGTAVLIYKSDGSVQDKYSFHH